MKATGIVRRIDDLGRIVIPKEIRLILGIKEGDALEIQIFGGSVVLKPRIPGDQWREALAEMGNRIIHDVNLRVETRIQLAKIINDMIDSFKEGVR